MGYGGSYFDHFMKQIYCNTNEIWCIDRSLTRFSERVLTI